MIELYMTLCYTMKHSDISLLCHIRKNEVYIILPVPSAFKPKYAYIGVHFQYQGNTCHFTAILFSKFRDQLPETSQFGL